MTNNQERIVKLVAEQLGVKEEEVTLTADFVDDLGADSLDSVEMVMTFEEEFNIEVNDYDAEQITNVQEALDYLEANR